MKSPPCACNSLTRRPPRLAISALPPARLRAPAAPIAASATLPGSRSATICRTVTPARGCAALSRKGELEPGDIRRDCVQGTKAAKPTRAIREKSSAVKHRRAGEAVEEQVSQIQPLATACPAFLDVGEGAVARRIAFLQRARAVGCNRAGLFWLGGFRSNMRGRKGEPP